MFSEIKTDNDIKYFLDKTNMLHDGYIIDIQYKHNGIKRIEDSLYFCPDQTKLTLQILVTSNFDTVVEIEFENVLEWQIKDAASYVFATYVYFSDEDSIVWSSEFYQNPDDLKKYSYVIAKSMKWRIVE